MIINAITTNVISNALCFFCVFIRYWWNISLFLKKNSTFYLTVHNFLSLAIYS